LDDVLVGMDPRKSLKIYPRIDNTFKTKSSFNYDMMRTRIFEERSNKNETIVIWFTHGLIGVFIGFVAFLMAVVEDEIILFKVEFMQYLIDECYGIGVAFAWYTTISAVCVLIACALTIYVGPAATGGGIAEIMGILNGINYKNVISMPTFLVKIFGTVFAVSGGLCIGKEGPLLHIGAIAGVLICYLPFDCF
jgi:H+/Cl- antiporter ClcA